MAARKSAADLIFAKAAERDAAAAKKRPVAKKKGDVGFETQSAAKSATNKVGEKKSKSLIGQIVDKSGLDSAGNIALKGVKKGASTLGMVERGLEAVANMAGGAADYAADKWLPDSINKDNKYQRVKNWYRPDRMVFGNEDERISLGKTLGAYQPYKKLPKKVRQATEIAGSIYLGSQYGGITSGALGRAGAEAEKAAARKLGEAAGSSVAAIQAKRAAGEITRRAAQKQTKRVLKVAEKAATTSERLKGSEVTRRLQDAANRAMEAGDASKEAMLRRAAETSARKGARGVSKQALDEAGVKFGVAYHGVVIPGTEKLAKAASQISPARLPKMAGQAIWHQAEKNDSLARKLLTATDRSVNNSGTADALRTGQRRYRQIGGEVALVGRKRGEVIASGVDRELGKFTDKWGSKINAMSDTQRQDYVTAMEAYGRNARTWTPEERVAVRRLQTGGFKGILKDARAYHDAEQKLIGGAYTEGFVPRVVSKDWEKAVKADRSLAGDAQAVKKYSVERSRLGPDEKFLGVELTGREKDTGGWTVARMNKVAQDKLGVKVYEYDPALGLSQNLGSTKAAIVKNARQLELAKAMPDRFNVSGVRQVENFKGGTKAEKDALGIAAQGQENLADWLGQNADIQRQYHADLARQRWEAARQASVPQSVADARTAAADAARSGRAKQYAADKVVPELIDVEGAKASIQRIAGERAEAGRQLARTPRVMSKQDLENATKKLISDKASVDQQLVRLRQVRAAAAASNPAVAKDAEEQIAALVKRQSKLQRDLAKAGEQAVAPAAVAAAAPAALPEAVPEVVTQAAKRGRKATLEESSQSARVGQIKYEIAKIESNLAGHRATIAAAEAPVNGAFDAATELERQAQEIFGTPFAQLTKNEQKSIKASVQLDRSVEKTKGSAIGKVFDLAAEQEDEAQYQFGKSYGDLTFKERRQVDGAMNKLMESKDQVIQGSEHADVARKTAADTARRAASQAEERLVALRAELANEEALAARTMPSAVDPGAGVAQQVVPDVAAAAPKAKRVPKPIDPVATKAELDNVTTQIEQLKTKVEVAPRAGVDKQIAELSERSADLKSKILAERSKYDPRAAQARKSAEQRVAAIDRRMEDAKKNLESLTGQRKRLEDTRTRLLAEAKDDFAQADLHRAAGDSALAAHHGMIAQAKATYTDALKLADSMGQAAKAMRTTSLQTLEKYNAITSEWGSEIVDLVDIAARKDWLHVGPAGAGNDLAMIGRGVDEKALYDAMHKLKEPNGWNNFLKPADALLSRWKAARLMTPGYHMRNGMGAVFTNWVRGVEWESYGLFARHNWNLQKALKANGGDMEAALQVIPDGLLRNGFREAYSTGAIGTHRNAVDFIDAMDGTTAGITSKLGMRKLEAFDPTSLNFKPFQLSHDVTNQLEDHVRGAQFLDAYLKNGGDAREALMRTIETHYDAKWVSGFEHDVMRRVVPFYTWTRQNFPAMMEAMAMHPGKAAALYRAKEVVESNVPVEQFEPGFLNSQFFVRTPFAFGATDPKTGERYKARAFLTPDLPMTDAWNWFGDPRGKALGSTNPVLQFLGSLAMTGGDDNTPWSIQYMDHYRPDLKEVGGWKGFVGRYGAPVLNHIPGFEVKGHVDGKHGTQMNEFTSKTLDAFLPFVDIADRVVNPWLGRGAADPTDYEKRVAGTLSSVGGVSTVANTRSLQRNEDYKRARQIRGKVKGMPKANSAGEVSSDELAGHQSFADSVLSKYR